MSQCRPPVNTSLAMARPSCHSMLWQPAISVQYTVAVLPYSLLRCGTIIYQSVIGQSVCQTVRQLSVLPVPPRPLSVRCISTACQSMPVSLVHVPPRPWTGSAPYPAGERHRKCTLPPVGIDAPIGGEGGSRWTTPARQQEALDHTNVYLHRLGPPGAWRRAEVNALSLVAGGQAAVSQPHGVGVEQKTWECLILVTDY